MPAETARSGRSARSRSPFSLIALAAVAFVSLVAAGHAEAQTRTLKFYNLHTKERGVYTYKRNGRFVEAEVQRINYMLRDWRKNEPIQMDRRLLDLVWTAYQQSGSNDYIHIISGYRSPGTNSMLRSSTSGVAKKSQHTLGRALDFYLPDVPLKKLRAIGLRMQVGGVGYYPTSGSPFVHFDVGNARHWPRMNRKQLVEVFPQGHTVHVPSDGKPLPGYKQAMADYKQRRSSATVQVANAEATGGGQSFLAMLFGGGNDAASSARQAPQPATRPAQTQVASRQPAQPSYAVPTGANAVLPSNRPTDLGAASTLVALAPANIPMPVFAPSREVGTAIEAVMTADASNAVDATASSVSEAGTATGAGTELAYAVPLPGARPLFDQVLDVAASGAGVATAQAPAEGEAAVRVAARQAGEKDVDALMVEAAASSGNAAAIRSAVPATAASFDFKGGRVVNLAAAQDRPRSRRVDPQEAIASRIAMASLVTDPDARAERSASVAGVPKSERLLDRHDGSVYLSAFRPAEAVEDQPSDRFAGSAVTFLRRMVVSD